MKEICLEQDTLESKMNPTFLAKEVAGMGCVEVRESDELMILEICCGSQIKKIQYWKN